MGVVVSLVRLDDSTIDEIVEEPHKLTHFWLQDDAPEESAPSFLAKIFGAKAIPLPRCSSAREPDDETDLDKSWDALDFILSRGRKEKGVIRFLAENEFGVEIPEEIVFGRPHALRSEEVSELSALLEGLSRDEIENNYNPKILDSERVYPGYWERDSDDNLEYILHYFAQLKEFLTKTSDQRKGLLIAYT